MNYILVNCADAIYLYVGKRVAFVKDTKKQLLFRAVWNSVVRELNS